MPDLVGKHVFGDFAVGRIGVLEGSGADAKAVLLNPGGTKPHDVNVELWSDGAEKKRFVAIPDGTKLHVEDDAT